MNKKLIDISIFILIIFLIITLILFAIDIRKEGTKCLVNPYNYSVLKAKQTTGLDISCLCSFNDSRYNPFIFDKDGIKNLFDNPVSDYVDITSLLNLSYNSQ
jgi:hypothetical protein